MISAMTGFVCGGAGTGRNPKKLKSCDDNLSFKWLDLVYFSGFNLGAVQFSKRSKILTEVFVPLSRLIRTVLLKHDKVLCFSQNVI